MPADTVPALFDFQVNGFAGVDFQDPEINRDELRRACEALRAHHMHRIFLTLITAPIERLAHQFERLESFLAADPVVADTVAGYHLEGPYLSAVEGYRGAHDPACMKDPDLREFDRLEKAAGGRIRLVTVAPERTGSADFIREITSRNIACGLGHTNASTADIDRAVEAGAVFCTHLGNGVPQQMHRHDNVVQRLLCRDELTACFIPDGIHLPPGVLRNFVRAKPPGKALFTTDCVSPAGAPPGRYRSLGVELEVGADRVVRVPGHSNFAGSALTLDQGVANLCAWLGLAPDDAWALCSTAPAKAFGVALPRIPRPEELPEPRSGMF